MALDFMRQAIALALANVRNGGGPFAAVIAKNGALIATGTNRVTAANDPTAHAEVVAIREACKRLESFQLDHCELFTTCEPCPGKTKAILMSSRSPAQRRSTPRPKGSRSSSRSSPGPIGTRG